MLTAPCILYRHYLLPVRRTSAQKAVAAAQPCVRSRAAPRHTTHLLRRQLHQCPCARECDQRFYTERCPDYVTWHFSATNAAHHGNYGAEHRTVTTYLSRRSLAMLTRCFSVRRHFDPTSAVSAGRTEHPVVTTSRRALIQLGCLLFVGVYWPNVSKLPSHGRPGRRLAVTSTRRAVVT